MLLEVRAAKTAMNTQINKMLSLHLFNIIIFHNQCRKSGVLDSPQNETGTSIHSPLSRGDQYHGYSFAANLGCDPWRPAG